MSLPELNDGDGREDGGGEVTIISQAQGSISNV